MLYYKRIAYIDYLENDIKVRNAGFIKIERSGEECTLTMQIKGLADRDCGIKEICDQKGKTMGTVQLEGGTGYWKTVLRLDEEMPEDGPRAVNIRLSPGRSLNAALEDAAVRTETEAVIYSPGHSRTEARGRRDGIAEFQALPQRRELWEEGGSRRDEIRPIPDGQGMEPVSFRGGRSEAAGYNAEQQALGAEASGGEEERTSYAAETSGGKEKRMAIGAQAPACEAEQVAFKTRRMPNRGGRVFNRGEYASHRGEPVSNQMDPACDREAVPAFNQVNPAFRQEDAPAFNQVNLTSSQEEAQVFKQVNPAFRQEDAQVVDQVNPASGREKAQVFKQAAQGAQTGMWETEAAESTRGTYSGAFRQGERHVQTPPEQYDAGELRRMMTEDRGRQKQCKQCPRNTPPTGEEFYADKWEQLQHNYPVIHPFGDDRAYLSIGPNDFVILESSFQKMVHNSFLLHGYYNYRHVILGKIRVEGEENYYLGVPGVYYDKEKMVAEMFGFEAFEGQNTPAEPGCFGYYMKKVRI